MSVVPLGIDPVDGGPVWAAARGSELVPGHLAWAPLTTGHHCQTWLCWSLDLWTPTVVKLARPGWSRPRWTRALDRERVALRRLRHPAFPRLLADGTRAEVPHLVLEHLDGPALDEVLDLDGPLSGADTARLGVGLGLRDVLGALTDPDPGARPTVDQSLVLLLRSAGRGDSRPWPRWADRALSDPPVAGTARREPNRPGSA